MPLEQFSNFFRRLIMKKTTPEKRVVATIDVNNFRV